MVEASQFDDTWYHDRADGAQPRDDLSCRVEPSRKSVAGGEIAIWRREISVVLYREEELRYRVVEAPTNKMRTADHIETPTKSSARA